MAIHSIPCGYGSKGYQYEWKREEGNKNVLRTHTTVASCRMLLGLAKTSGSGNVEIGNSGMFRPEMLRSIGSPEDVWVIAWGLSLERYKNFGTYGQSTLANELPRHFKPLVIALANMYAETSIKLIGIEIVCNLNRRSDGCRDVHQVNWDRNCRFLNLHLIYVFEGKQNISLHQF